jgi:hypothetical protein
MNVPEFKRLARWMGGHFRKRWYKRKKHRGNRKRLRQARDIENHCDKPLDPWALD